MPPDPHPVASDRADDFSCSSKHLPTAGVSLARVACLSWGSVPCESHVMPGEARLVFREAGRSNRERSGAAALLRPTVPGVEGHSTSALPSSGISLPHDVLLHPSPGELVSSRSALMGFTRSERRLDRPCGRPGHHASSLSRIRAADVFRRSRPVRFPHQGFLPDCDGAVFTPHRLPGATCTSPPPMRFVAAKSPPAQALHCYRALRSFDRDRVGVLSAS